MSASNFSIDPVPPSTNPTSNAAVAAAPAKTQVSTPALLAAMLRSAPKISDLFFSPGKPPLVEVNGRLANVGSHALTPEMTRQIANDLIGSNAHALEHLREHGSCDVSYSLAGTSRFRV